MKTLLISIAVIALCTFGFTQFTSYKRAQKLNEFDYITMKDIDVNYYNTEVIKQYYVNAYEISGLGKQLWLDRGIDIRSSGDKSPEVIQAINLYKVLLINIKMNEVKLLQSKVLKSKGFDNNDIKIIQEQGLSPERYYALKDINVKALNSSEPNSSMYRVQKLLMESGYPVTLSSKLDAQTTSAIQLFQTRSNIYPSGEIDTETLDALYKIK